MMGTVSLISIVFLLLLLYIP